MTGPLVHCVMKEPHARCDMKGPLVHCDIMKEPHARCDTKGPLVHCDIMKEPHARCDMKGPLVHCDIMKEPHARCDTKEPHSWATPKVVGSMHREAHRRSLLLWPLFVQRSGQTFLYTVAVAVHW